MSSLPVDGAGQANMASVDDLPLQPSITPALAVAGVLLMLTGATYCFVGIKRKWIQVPIASAYLVALAITVLIVYIAEPPVSEALQGAYLVAIAAPALVLAPLAYIFKDVTEGFSCAVGGFAVSMFLLVLHPGGLLPSTSQKAIFIICWTLGIYCFAFSHYTRTYASIASSAIGGATAIVLGIDCFSEAGLKEFWVYIWGLNTSLFPASTQTYPLTRGMRVEIAAMVVLTFFGILSQVQIWKIVRRQKQDRENKHREARRRQSDLEAEVGRKINAEAAEGRQEWEVLYGDAKKQLSESKTMDINSESEVGTSASSTRKNSGIEAPASGENVKTGTLQASSLRQVLETPGETAVVELVEIPNGGASAPAKIDSKWPFSSINAIDGANRMSQDGSQRVSMTERKSLTWELPRSEQVVFAQTHVESEIVVSEKPSENVSVVHESVMMPNLSIEKTMISGPSRTNRYSTYTVTSVEALADPSFYDDCFSIGALDFLECGTEPSVKASEELIRGNSQDESIKSATVDLDDSDGSLPAETVVTEDSETVPFALLGREENGPTSSKPESATVDGTLEPAAPQESTAPTSESTEQLKSKASLQSLKEERSEKASPVVQRYRTNEWAKHLSLAEEPEQDPIQAVESDETPTPLNTKELVQTPLTADPEPEVTSRSETSSPSLQCTPGGRPIPSFKHSSYGSSTQSASSRAPMGAEPRTQDVRRASQPGLSRQSFRRGASGLRNGVSLAVNSPISEDEEMSFHTVPSPPTLLGDRRTLLQQRDMSGVARRVVSLPQLHPSVSAPTLRQDSSHSLRSVSTNSQGESDDSQSLSNRRQQLKLQKAPTRASMPTAPSRAAPRSMTYPPQPDHLAVPQRVVSAQQLSPNQYQYRPLQQVQLQPQAYQYPTQSPYTHHVYPTPPSNRNSLDQSLRRRTMLAQWHSSLASERTRNSVATTSPWTAQGFDAIPQPVVAAPAPALARERIVSQPDLSSLQSLERPQTTTWRDRQTRGGQEGWGTQGEANQYAALGGAQKLNSAHREVMRRMQAGANARLKTEDTL